jgi:uncharacterized protein (TIGR02453 family)
MQTIFDFLNGLSQNNTREWFDAHRDLYEQAKAEHHQLLTDILTHLTKIEPEFVHLKAKDCTFRIFRDVRFSKDKTPYKDHFGAYLERDGRKSIRAGYYLHLQPGGSMLAGGMWMPEPDMLRKIRQEIDYNAPKFRQIIDSETFVKNYGSLLREDQLFGMPRQLKRNPKEYPADHPESELLRLKDFSVSHSLTDAQVLAPGFAAQAVQIWQTLKPLNDFLNEAVEH